MSYQNGILLCSIVVIPDAVFVMFHFINRSECLSYFWPTKSNLLALEGIFSTFLVHCVGKIYYANSYSARSSPCPSFAACDISNILDTCYLASSFSFSVANRSPLIDHIFQESLFIYPFCGNVKLKFLSHELFAFFKAGLSLVVYILFRCPFRINFATFLGASVCFENLEMFINIQVYYFNKVSGT